MDAELKVSSTCVDCDICRPLCPETAIIYHNHQYFIDSWLCTLCGICIEICPTDAIAPEKTEEELAPILKTTKRKFSKNYR